jgi:hypothetical protein
MSSVSPSSNDVLRSFIGAANKQYRDAGLDEYQMKVDRHGNVTVPHASAGFKTPAASGSAAPEQAKAGAAPAPGPAATPAGADPTKAKRSGAPPKVVDLAQSGQDAFKIGWQPVQGAQQYGVWQDGKLLGHVSSPSFAAQLAPGAGGVIQIDAVRGDGTRTPLTRALRVARTADGKITFDVPGATPGAPAPTGGASAPAPTGGAPAPAPTGGAPVPAPAGGATTPAAPAG